ncbi:MAG: hypothetical protein ABIW79_09255, partial [Gemmatimonas sp.]
DSLPQIGQVVGAVIRAIGNDRNGRDIARQVVSELREHVKRESKRTRQLQKGLTEAMERELERTHELRERVAEARRNKR